MKYLYTLIAVFLFVTSSGQHITSTVVYFNFDRSEPDAANTRTLNEFLDKALLLRVTAVSIEGHTDKRGDTAYNENLSKERAAAVKQLVEARLRPGVPVNLGYRGEAKPVTFNDEQQAMNRRVIVTVHYEDEPARPATRLEPFFEDVETQRFTVNLDDTILIRAREGTTIKIAPGSIQTKTGERARGTADILVKEYFQPGDIVLSGLNTESEQGLLQSGGMFRMVVVQGPDTMSSRTKKPVEIKIPASPGSYGNMNVYTMNREGSNTWDKTGDVFIHTQGHWLWPEKAGHLENLWVPQFRFENWNVGRKYTDVYHAREPRWWMFEIPMGNDSEIGEVTNTIEKIDSVTLRSTIKAAYRKKAAKKYNTRHFDTSFLVKYRQTQYVTMSGNINWINCDRFINQGNTIDFYVTTPGFEGANVVIYFKSLNACMHAKPGSDSLYTVNRIPPGEKIVVLAFGKKDGNYFYARKEFVTGKNLVAGLSMQETSEEEFRKSLRKI